MSNIKIQTPRGTKDLFGEEISIFSKIIETSKHISALYNCQELMTPIFEHVEVFKKSLGEESDVIGKEMYNFLDKGGDEMVLRPEFTSAIVRSVASNNLFHYLPLRFFSYGSLFRYERPQKGRFRQFHQINIEFIGEDSVESDVELIGLARDILVKLGIYDKVTLNINSLGDNESRQKYRALLVDYLNDYKDALSEDSQRRLIKNPLRILDSKNEQDKEIVKNAPKLSQVITNEAQEYFDRVLENLNILNINFVVNQNLVRGLDYYDHTVFEFITEELGSQGSVIAGGRYNGLFKMMTGQDTKSVGFAGGIERMIELMKLNNHSIEKQRPFAIVAIGEQAESQALLLASLLRENNKPVVITPSNANVGKKMKFANKVNAQYALIFGEDELNKQVIKLKNFDSGIESEINTNEILDRLPN